MFGERLSCVGVPRWYFLSREEAALSFREIRSEVNSLMSAVAVVIRSQGRESRGGAISLGRPQDLRESSKRSVPGKISGPSPVPAKQEAFPTVLVAMESGEVRETLVDHLQREQYLVLEADDAKRALSVIIGHSRPIHVLLLANHPDNSVLLNSLSRYRPDMQVLPVSIGSDPGPFGALPAEAVLKEVRELLKPAKPKAMGAA